MKAEMKVIGMDKNRNESNGKDKIKNESKGERKYKKERMP